MDFANRAQQHCYEQAQRHLEGAFGPQVQEHPHEPSFFVATGRVGVRVDVTAVGEDDAVIDVLSWIAQGLPVTPDVGEWLARRAISLGFGALAIDGEDAIILQHSLFAEGANGVVLPRLVALMGTTADAIDAELREEFTTYG